MRWTTEHWPRIEALFHEALQQPPASRRAFVAAAAGDDADLCHAVEQLLRADDEPDDHVEAGAAVLLRGVDPLLQARFGAFRLVERMAEGGMGAVYRAERVDGGFAQTAAVKVLRFGLSTASMRERFLRERQTLARLVHPNVARLLDGGTNERHVPFFAMELVDGLPIDRYCDARQAPLRERLQLFATVCRAVHFAHQNLVLHLDLKPGNILVDVHGAPKLVDFGVAALLQAAEGTAAGTAARPLTPEYASPEQLRGETLSTASDVYSLGVVLFELLTGTRPFRRADHSGIALTQAILTAPAPRPSAMWTATADGDGDTGLAPRARQRGSSPRVLGRALRGDLDRIAAMAMAKEPARRYASAKEFADDLDRHLAGLPVTAAEPGLGYRLRRFVGRNRLAVAAAAMVTVSLVAGIVATASMARVAGAERDAAKAARDRIAQEMEHARIEAASSNVVASFLSDTFLASGLTDAKAQDTLRAILLQRADQVRRQYAGNDHLRANLLDALGRTATEADLLAEAGHLIGEAKAIRVATFGTGSLEHALSLNSLGKLYYRQGDFSAAVVAFEQSYRLHQVCPPDVHTDVAAAANDLAAAERAVGHRERARELHREALALRRSEGETTAVAESLNNLAAAESDPELALQAMNEALAIRSRLLGDGDPATVQTRINLGMLRLQRGELDAASALLRDGVTQSRALAGRGIDGLAVALRGLAYTDLRQDRIDDALLEIEEALAIDGRRFHNEHARLAKSREVRALILDRRSDPEAAVDAWQEVLRARQQTLPPGHPDVGGTMVSLGSALARAGREEAAEQQWQQALTVLPADAPSRAAARKLLHDFYARRGRPEAARYAADGK
jgi:serine/threonine-protein kinase